MEANNKQLSTSMFGSLSSQKEVLKKQFDCHHEEKNEINCLQREL